MGLSLEEAERLGIAAEHPDHPARRQEAKRRPAPKVDDRGMNKLESGFATYLDDLKARRRVSDYRFEAVKIRLAGRCWYRIDFVVKRRDGSLAGCELKGGFAREDSIIKLKLAPESFPFMDYYLVRRDRACTAGWNVRKIGRNGIGVHPIGEDWLS